MQLAFNFAWSLIFFGAQRIELALADIIALAVAIAVTLVLFIRVDRIAGWLLVPYLAWVMFASVLNGAIARLN